MENVILGRLAIDAKLADLDRAALEARTSRIIRELYADVPQEAASVDRELFRRFAWFGLDS